ncbi:GGDEF domain-containing protein [Erysipelotrichaceae bacterium Oil+RF-744-GAM-WT-6]|uniref:GGDEF domain-containing protein n=2 Tax=Stecheria intestinalis TaxID=2606630 RepID=A0A7X2NSL1_9FIRM|nr:GGDEF domain-containing protein [Stecheria intestinalis]
MQARQRKMHEGGNDGRLQCQKEQGYLNGYPARGREQMKTRNRRLWMAAYTVIAVFLLVLWTAIQVHGNRRRAEHASELLMAQAEKIIQTNEEEEKILTESLKENYMTRAEAVAYILDHGGGTEDLEEIASLMKVDEIHIFDETGTIISGTHPEFYGFSFDSGEQIGYFKPMLEDQELTMCQDVMPNTADGRQMMYAMCWNSTGEYMVQVGINPVRLLEELRANEIPEVIAGMTHYEGTALIVASMEGTILGATDSSMEGMTLAEAGIDPSRTDHFNTSFTAEVNGRRCYCNVQMSGDYIIAVAQEVSMVNEDLPASLMMLVIYLAGAGILILVLVGVMNRRIRHAHAEATTDVMTGFLNRRAYAEAMKREQLNTDPLKVYAFIDINGLKRVNDTLGHDAGDELIIAAAQCMQKCMGPYGDLYRIGGDEFAALLRADAELEKQIREEFHQEVSSWQGKLSDRLSVSCGCASRAVYVGASIQDLERYAEEEMYEAKKRYYRENSREDRRKETTGKSGMETGVGF